MYGVLRYGNSQLQKIKLCWYQMPSVLRIITLSAPQLCSITLKYLEIVCSYNKFCFYMEKLACFIYLHSQQSHGSVVSQRTWLTKYPQYKDCAWVNQAFYASCKLLTFILCQWTFCIFNGISNLENLLY